MSENLLDLIPAFRRQLGRYVRQESDSQLAGYLNDSIEALNWLWNRSYTITYTAPNTYMVDPAITATDRRPIILMAGIIYKISMIQTAAIRDGDFAYDPSRRVDPLANDFKQLEVMVPSNSVNLLQSATTSPLRGFENVYNKESYSYLLDWFSIYTS